MNASSEDACWDIEGTQRTITLRSRFQNVSINVFRIRGRKNQCVVTPERINVLSSRPSHPWQVPRQWPAGALPYLHSCLPGLQIGWMRANRIWKISQICFPFFTNNILVISLKMLAKNNANLQAKLSPFSPVSVRHRFLQLNTSIYVVAYVDSYKMV